MANGILDVFDRYPSPSAFLFLAGGILTARLVHPCGETLPLCALTIALGLLFPTVRYDRTRLLWPVVCLLFFCIGLNSASAQFAAGHDFSPSTEKEIVHATVVETLSSKPNCTVFLVGSGVEAQRARVLPGMGRLFVRNNAEHFNAGDRISFRAQIRKPKNRGNPGEFDWELYCRSNGITWTASVQGRDSVLLIRRAAPWSPRYLVSRLRKAVVRFIEEHSTGDVRAVLKGIVVGDRGEISPSLNESYTDSGLVHVLSASGLHVGFAAAMALPLVAAAVRLRPSVLLWAPYAKIAAAGSILPMLVYCFLAGARVPIVRATIMGMVVATAILLNRRWYSINSLAVAGVIVLLIFPLSLFAIDFQLSFAAVLGIVIIVPPVMRRFYQRQTPTEGAMAGEVGKDRRHPFVRGARSARVAALVAGMTTLAATIAVSPILMQVFHVIPMYGIVANFAAVPLLTPALPLALAGSFVGLIWPSAGALLLAPAELLIHWVNKIAALVAALPFSTLHVPDSSLAAPIVGAFLIAGLALMFLGRSVLRAAATLAAGLIAAAAMAWVAILWQDAKTLTVVFFNVGKADAAYVKPPGCAGVLIDGGLRTAYFDTGESILAPYFRRNGVRRLEGMMISHPDMDHMGGLLTITQKVPPATVWFNDTGYSPNFFRKVLDAASASGAQLLAADRTCQPARLGPVTMTFLNRQVPTLARGHTGEDVNNASIVCRLDYDEVSFLFTGDLAEEGEAELIAAGAYLRATVLKVGHHGCKRSTTRRFLKAVHPSVAVISCDETGRGPCPNSTVIADLQAAGAHIFHTGRDGAVIVETDGKEFSVKTGKKRTVGGGRSP